MTVMMMVIKGFVYMAYFVVYLLGCCLYCYVVYFFCERRRVLHYFCFLSVLTNLASELLFLLFNCV